MEVRGVRCLSGAGGMMWGVALLATPCAACDEIGWTSGTNVKAPTTAAPLLISYNDGKMRLPAEADTWTTGRYKGVLIGMFKPVART